MEALIIGTFRDEVPDERVERSQYDLTGPDDLVILPQVWQAVLRPG